jgi:membrane fusion protein
MPNDQRLEFREAAVKYVAHRLEGSVMIGAPLSQKFISWTFFVLILLGLLFATVSTYPRRETVSGWLYPSGGIIRVPRDKAE